jgi:hypothetical protein
VPYALEKLISGYKEIAANLPRFDRLSATFAQDKNFQRVLAVFYEDVLEFHRRAYKFVRRRGLSDVLDLQIDLTSAVANHGQDGLSFSSQPGTSSIADFKAS